MIQSEWPTAINSHLPRILFSDITDLLIYILNLCDDARNLDVQAIVLSAAKLNEHVWDI